MLDLSEEFDEENIATCAKYFKRMAPMKMWLEMEIGITGGEEDGVDNTGVKAESLYTKPEQVWNVYKTLSAIGPMFSIAAAFGNVHGVYKAGNVVLSPQLLAGHQEFIQKQLGTLLNFLHDQRSCLIQLRWRVKVILEKSNPAMNQKRHI